MRIPVKGLFCYTFAMMDVTKSLPEDPDELRAFTALLLAEVKSQAVLIAKLRHQLAGQRAHRFGPAPVPLAARMHEEQRSKSPHATQ